MGEEREMAQKFVDKIIEAERMGGGFRLVHEAAVAQLEKLMIEHKRMKERCDALDAAHATTVHR